MASALDKQARQLRQMIDDGQTDKKRRREKKGVIDKDEEWLRRYAEREVKEKAQTLFKECLVEIKEAFIAKEKSVKIESSVIGLNLFNENQRVAKMASDRLKKAGFSASVHAGENSHLSSGGTSYFITLHITF